MEEWVDARLVAAPSSNHTVVRDPHLTERIWLFERRLRAALPEELTDADRAALEQLLETVRALARDKPPPPWSADPHPDNP
jgi:hypothetical protein